MRRRGLLVALLLVLALPAPSAALQLRWANGADTLSFAVATRCTLVVETDPAEGSLPAEWRLLWVAEGLPDLVIVPDSTFDGSGMAQAVSVLPPTMAEADANVVTANFRLPGSPAITAARWILDLPAGAAGKFIAYAFNAETAGASGSLRQSQVAIFNGGVAMEFPALAIGASGDHATSRFSVRTLGRGIGQASAAALVAADTSWRVPLTIIESTDSTLAAEADVFAELPDAILLISTPGGASTTTPLATSEVASAVTLPVTIRGNSFLLPPDSTGVLPKDFAFFYNTVPTEVPGVRRGLFHIIYIRRLPSGDEFNLGHAWSTDLETWTCDRYHFLQGPSGSWDQQHVWAPSIVQNGNLYHMFYTGVDAGGNQRIGRVTTTLLDTTNTVWDDRTLVFAADSTSWVVRHPSSFSGADQFRDPFVFRDPDSVGRFLMVYTAMDTSFKAQLGHSVGLARNRSGTLDRWIDISRYESTNYASNGGRWQVESPLVIPDSGYTHPYWLAGDQPAGWRLVYTWGGDHPSDQVLRMLKDTLDVNVADTLASAWGFTQSLHDYLSGDATVDGLQAAEHLKAGNVDYLAGYNAYLVDGIQISRMYWTGSDFYLQVPNVTGIDVAGSVTASVRLSILDFEPRVRTVQFRISLPAALPVRLDVYDVAGRRLRKLVDARLPAGDTIVSWDRSAADGAALASGVYFARLTYSSGSRVAKIPLVR